MDVDYPPQAEAFRDRIRAFLAEHLPPDWSGGGALAPEERAAVARRWRQSLAAAGLVAVSWPKAYGGGGLSVIEQVVLDEEFARAGAPERAENDLLGIQLLGNTLIALGTEEQKRHFLPRILSAEDRWCQGFSEPEAGSDLASVRTRAVLDDDEWVINGQKIWTSAGPTANWIFVLARTDTEAPKHKGLSLLLVPIDQPGVVVRPIVNAAGHASFSEVFFTDARTPAVNVVGRVGDGWPAAMTVLGFERGSQVTTAAINFGREMDRLRELARDRGLHTDARIREMDFGDREMQRWDAVPRAAFDAWTSHFGRHRFGGVECVDALIGRVADALDDTRAQVGAGGEALWITHAGVIRSVLFLAEHGRRPVASVDEWPRNAPDTGEWITLSC